jgi:hypothetical protein
MDKTKPLESLKDELFQNLPDADLGRASGGATLRSSASKGGVTHIGKIFDEEFVD